MAALTSWTPNKKHSDRERWICIYPAYINSKKTIAEGRRISKEKEKYPTKPSEIIAVENPTHQEIRDVLSAAGLKIGVENKFYSRESSKEMLYRGRIRVQLRNDDGTPFNPNFPTRDSILLHLGETIPKLKSRSGKQVSGDSGQSQSAGGAKKKSKGRR